MDIGWTKMYDGFAGSPFCCCRHILLLYLFDVDFIECFCYNNKSEFKCYRCDEFLVIVSLEWSMCFNELEVSDRL